uniref:Prohibitin n=1 Tax=Lotharella globosa TaxID=91324 RepID=A0A7S4DV99_9EUKA
MKAPRIPPVPRGSGRIAQVLLGAAGAAYLAYNGMYNVQGGQKAVIFSRYSGVGKQVYGEGTHICVPWLHRPQIFDVRTRPKKMRSISGTKDLQMVDIEMRVLYKPRTTMLPLIWSRFGTDYDERILPSIISETLKAAIAQFDAAQLITKREEVSKLVRRNLKERAGRDFFIEIEDVAITHLGFGREYTKAIEDKQVAQQEAERAKFLVQRALQEKKAMVIQAQGEARSAELIGNAMQRDASYLELKRLDAAKEIATNVARSNNSVYLNSESLLLNLLDDSTETLAPKK